MATLPSRPTPPDTELAERTLRRMGKALQVRLFRLRAEIRARRLAERHEATTRREIKALKGRIQWELDANPTLFRGARPEDIGAEGAGE